jgi:pimeloyl-ACP methyl ester carboxylesterase
MIAVCAAHPVDRFDAETATLLSQTARATVTCVNPRPGPLDAMIDDLEAARRDHGIARWVFWGMSGGGWLALLYARRHPEAVAGIVVESADACFRARLADPACILSPNHPLWRADLERAGLLAADAHADPSPLDDVEWLDTTGGGAILRRRGGPALLVSPAPLSEAMRAALPTFWTFDARPWLGELALPALVVAGTADPIVPVASVRAVADAIPGASFVVVEGAGHVPTVERRPEVAAAVRALLATAR